MGLFTRKRPQIYHWDDSYQLALHKTLYRRQVPTYVFTCPSDLYMQFISFTARITYNAGIASRATWIDIKDGSETIFISSTYLLAGTTTHQFHFADHYTQARANTGLERLYVPMPKPAFLLPGWRLTLTTTGGLPNDEIQYTCLAVKQWYFK